MSKWLNNKRIVNDQSLKKPCHKLKYCPYGQLVEEFPLHPKVRNMETRKIECKVFGHDCPAYYMKEDFSEK